MNLKEILLSRPTDHLHIYINGQEVINFINDRLPENEYVSLMHSQNQAIFSAIMFLPEQDRVTVLATTMYPKKTGDKLDSIVILVVTIIVSFLMMLATLVGTPINNDGTNQSVIDQLIDAVAQSIIEQLK